MRSLVLFLCLFSSASAWAGIGNVAESTGAPGEITRGKDKVAGTKGAGIESNDIYTTKNGSVQLSFVDDTKVKITENSRLLIDDFVFDPKKSDAGKLALKVGMGTVRYASGQIAKTNAQQVAIKTPTASVAVRGTDFTMTVDETGQSLIVLVPSCKEGEKVKEYELEENKCRVGSIEVETSAGKVVLDSAFQGTFVASSNLPPTPPVVMSMVESKISNNLIIVKPMEIVKAINTQSGKTKREHDQEQEEQEQTRRLGEKIKKQDAEEQAKIIAANSYKIDTSCNATTTVCVLWEKSEGELSARGKGVAYRNTENEHYAEVKTQGYSSNTLVTIVHNDAIASELIGDGSPGGNIVYIKQNSGLRRNVK
jgi:hypothetical protein